MAPLLHPPFACRVRGTAPPCAPWVMGLFALAALGGCASRSDDPGLSKPSADETIPNVPEPAASGPKPGAAANVPPVLERPALGARQLGYLLAGARVARAAEPYSRR